MVSRGSGHPSQARPTSLDVFDCVLHRVWHEVQQLTRPPVSTKAAEVDLVSHVFLARIVTK